MSLFTLLPLPLTAPSLLPSLARTHIPSLSNNNLLPLPLTAPSLSPCISKAAARSRASTPPRPPPLPWRGACARRTTRRPCPCCRPPPRSAEPLSTPYLGHYLSFSSPYLCPRPDPPSPFHPIPSLRPSTDYPSQPPPLPYSAFDAQGAAGAAWRQWDTPGVHYLAPALTLAQVCHHPRLSLADT